MQKILILSLLLIYSCNKLPDSKGDYNQVVIISSDIDKPIIFDRINNLLSDYINTPNEEKLLEVKWISSKNFSDYLDYRNIIFFSLDEPADSTIDLLVNKFNKNYKTNLFALSDVYSKNQLLVFLKTKDSASFVQDLDVNSDWILDNLNENVDKYLYSYIYINGTNDSINNIINKSFKMDFISQKDYLVVKNDIDNESFLWIGRGYPYRWLTFKKINLNSDILLFEEFKNHIHNDMPNVKITDYYKNLLYESDDIIKIQGLYEEEKSNTGGPFISYAKLFRDYNQAIIITGFVNNPGKDKIRLLKELELQIKNTIHRGDYEK